MGTSLPARLVGDDEQPAVTAFPDGSVDHYYEVFDGDRRLQSREAFAEAAAAGRTAAFTLRRRAVEPGGHAVNAAVQADLLGDDVTLVGHLDDAVLADLPFETISMGDPARVAVHRFDDGAVLTADPSTDVAEWSLADLREATDGAFRSLLSADVVLCTNWTSFDALPDALAELAAVDLDGGYFVFDPGGMAGRSDAAVRRLLGALADLTTSYDVVLAANGDEVRSLTGVVADDEATADVGESLERLRAATDAAAAVVHEADAAVAATPAGDVRVENFEVDPVRHVGGGDRFDAGLGHALARGWSWTDALGLGNACASRYVATGEAGTAADLAAFLRRRE